MIPLAVDVYAGERNETIRLATLPLDEIRIPDFQREKKRHHAAIAAEFDRTAYAFPLILIFDDVYMCVDGQQRVEALRMRGELEATMLVIEGVTSQKRAAEIYVRVNRDRKNLNAYEKFVGSHAAQDPGTRAITKILEDCSLRAGKSAGVEDHVPAGAVTSIYNRYGGDILLRTLEIRELAWGNENARESRESRTLSGLAAFLKCYFDELDDGHLVDVLRKIHPSSVLSRVEGHTSPGTLSTRYAAFVKTLYNKAARGKVRRLR